MESFTSYGRRIGLLYAIVIACGVFAQFYVRGTMAESPADYVAEQELLFRLGFLADIIMQLAYLFIGIKMYWVFQSIDRKNALLLLISVVLAVVLMVSNMLNFYEPLLWVDTMESKTLSFSQGLALHQTGYYLAQVFFGLWLIPLGIVVRKSGYMPRFIGFMLIVGGASYLLDFVLQFLNPELAKVWSARITLPADLAEFWLCSYLLVFGFRIKEMTIKQIQQL
jgi:hypothetical protein